MSDKDTRFKLKPCPFCGAKPIIHHHHDPGFKKGEGEDLYWMECATPNCLLEDLLDTYPIPESGLEEFIESWNRRAETGT
jgi:Lar family restriction alleviation protein